MSSRLLLVAMTLAIPGECFPAKDRDNPPTKDDMEQEEPEPDMEQEEPEPEPEPELDMANDEGDEPTTGDGDGDGTGQASCGWDAQLLYYVCGGMGEDPSGESPIACPPDLVEGAECGLIDGIGCCDEDGDNWYCGELGNGEIKLVRDDCV